MNLKKTAFFVVNFLDRINWRMYGFLDFCASGDPENIEHDKLTFSDMLK